MNNQLSLVTDAEEFKEDRAVDGVSRRIVMPIEGDEHVADLAIDHRLNLLDKGSKLGVTNVLWECCLVLHADVLSVDTCQ